MTDREKGSESERDRAGQSRDQDSIIPDRHGKHGGGEESEGAPQDEAPEAPAPREHSNGNRTRR